MILNKIFLFVLICGMSAVKLPARDYDSALRPLASHVLRPRLLEG
jgi:hypothetical protein